MLTIDGMDYDIVGQWETIHLVSDQFGSVSPVNICAKQRLVTLLYADDGVDDEATTLKAAAPTTTFNVAAWIICIVLFGVGGVTY